MAASDVVRDCLHLEKAEGGSLWFSSAGEYLKHLLQAVSIVYTSTILWATHVTIIVCMWCLQIATFRLRL